MAAPVEPPMTAPIGPPSRKPMVPPVQAPAVPPTTAPPSWACAWAGMAAADRAATAAPIIRSLRIVLSPRLGFGVANVGPPGRFRMGVCTIAADELKGPGLRG